MLHVALLGQQVIADEEGGPRAAVVAGDRAGRPTSSAHAGPSSPARASPPSSGPTPATPRR